MPTEFSAGRVLGRSFSLLLANGGAFLLMIVLLHLPIVLFRIYLTTASASAALQANAQFFVLCAGMLLQPLASASVTYGVLQQLRGKPVTFTACLNVGFSRMFAVFLVGIVAGLLTLLGALAFCVPGLIASTMFFVATPASVVERLDVGGALRRSHELTLGSRWGIFLLNLLIFGITLGVALGLSVAFVDLRAPKFTESRAYLVVTLVTSLLMQALQSIAGAVTYSELRKARDGAPPPDFLSAFD